MAESESKKGISGFGTRMGGGTKKNPTIKKKDIKKHQDKRKKIGSLKDIREAYKKLVGSK